LNAAAMNQTEPNPAERPLPRFDATQSQSDFEYGFFGEMVRRGTNNVHVLKQQAELLVLRGEREAALEIERKLAELLPEDPIIRYNLACGLAVTGQSEAAFAQLLEAVRLGYRDFDLMDSDADLDGLRNHQGFLKLLESQQNADPA
jgi:predicted Zn-dependent protease